MDCPEFRELYGDYRDGNLSEAAEVAVRRHLSSCGGCRRFDQAYTAGLECLRSMPVASSSCHFAARLSRKLNREVFAKRPEPRAWPRMAGALVAVAVVGVVAWGRLRSPGGPLRVETRAAVYRIVPSAALHVTRDSLARLRASFELLPPQTPVWHTGGRLDISAAWASR